MAIPGTNNEVVEEGSLAEGLMKPLVPLASKWGDSIDMKTLKVVELTGGMSNKIYCVSWPTDDENVLRTVLVRIYGEDVENFIDRKVEIRNFEYVSMLEYGPKLYGLFAGGRLEEFIHARTLLPCDLRDPEISALVAAKLRKFHLLDIPGPKKANLWDIIRNWLAKARSICTVEHAKEFRLDILEEEITMLESELSNGYDQDIGFCHNDLQYGNILFDEKTRTITIIDYEYASYNPIAYDIGNHFCEMVANYQSDTPPALNYNIYPKLEERQRFVRLYLTSTGNQPSDADVQKLVNEAEKYTLASHLMMGLWALISNYTSNIDLDYIDGARLRFEQYWLRKPQLLEKILVIPINHVDGHEAL